jgi:hypothetical protein
MWHGESMTTGMRRKFVLCGVKFVVSRAVLIQVLFTYASSAHAEPPYDTMNLWDVPDLAQQKRSTGIR